MAEDQTKCLHCPFTGTPQEVNHHKLLCKVKGKSNQLATEDVPKMVAEDQNKCTHCPFTGTPEEAKDHKFLCKAKTEEERKELYQAEMMQWRLENREAILGIKRQEDALFELAKKKKNSKSPSVGQQWSEPRDIPSERPNSETYEMRHAGVPLDLIPWRDHGADNATTPTSTKSGSPKKRVLSDVLGRKDS